MELFGRDSEIAKFKETIEKQNVKISYVNNLIQKYENTLLFKISKRFRYILSELKKEMEKR